MTKQLDSAFVYNDIGGLNSIKQASRGADSDQALRAVAQQFESMFMQQIMKSMHDANKSLNPDSMFDSSESESWQDMHRQQFSLSLSQDGGMGLADVLYQQMKDQQPKEFDGDLSMKSLAESGRPIVAARKPRSDDDIGANELLNMWVDKAKGAAKAEPQSFSSPSDFIAKLYPYAQKAASLLGVEPKFLIAQAALETGWGQKLINHQDGSASFNLFGIKANKGWQGEQTSITTHEFMQGRKVKIQDEFRAYRNWQHGFDDYVNFIKTNERYQTAVANAGDANRYFEELQKAGYATDPNYADKINRVANGSVMSSTLNALGEVS